MPAKICPLADPPPHEEGTGVVCYGGRCNRGVLALFSCVRALPGRCLGDSNIPILLKVAHAMLACLRNLAQSTWNQKLPLQASLCAFILLDALNAEFYHSLHGGPGGCGRMRGATSLNQKPTFIAYFVGSEA